MIKNTLLVVLCGLFSTTSFACDLLGEDPSTKEIVAAYNCLLKRPKITVIPIDCFASQNSQFNTTSERFDKDIFYCEVNFPTKGTLYLSLQGNQKSNNGGACSFGIYVDGKLINTAGRNLPSHTYLTNWHPSFMSDTVSISSGEHKISLRVEGENCSIHDPDINGFYIAEK